MFYKILVRNIACVWLQYNADTFSLDWLFFTGNKVRFFFICFLNALYSNSSLRCTLSSYIQHVLSYDIDCSASVCQVV